MSVYFDIPTNKPVNYDAFSFGGDDTKKYPRHAAFISLAVWKHELETNSSPGFTREKSIILYLSKKIFSILDRLGAGAFFFGYAGFNGVMKEASYWIMGMGRNAAAREKIISALNTPIRLIPTVQIAERELTPYLKLNDNHFRSGEWLVQGEDPAGRKFLAARLQDRSGSVNIATIHQRFRETKISTSPEGDGALWTLNCGDKVHLDLTVITTFVSQIRSNTHAELSYSLKP